MLNRLLIALVVACMSSLTTSAQMSAPFTFHFTAPFGRHAVGFRVLQQTDPSRPFLLSPDHPTERIGRPLQTLLWYPALHSDRAPMTLGQFESLIQTETNFAHPQTDGAPQKFVTSFMAGTEAEPTVSVEGASPVPGKYPVVIYAPSLDGPATENIELCEYLASEGYLVISSASLGAQSSKMTVDDRGALAQSADIAFLIRYAKSLADADPTKVAVIGYSWGAMGALIAVEHDPAIKALISMDGSFRYALPPGFARSPLSLPLLLFTRGETPLMPQTTGDAASQKAGADIEAQFRGPLLQVHLLAVSHIQFSSLFQRSDRFRREGMQFVPSGHNLTDGIASYAWMARYIAEFLNAYLKGTSTAMRFLKHAPSENGVPPGLMETNFRSATANPSA